MKKILSLLVLVAISFVACQTDPSTEVIGGESGPTTLTITLDDTRTALGDKVGDNYPLYWSEGDKLVVNGKQSNPACIDAENAKCATFQFNDELSYPYRITYPYCASTQPLMPMVNFPAEQTYKEGTFSEGCAPMCGYVAEKGANVELKHLSGIMRFPIKAEREGVELRKVVITSSSAKLSGDFSVNCKNATLTQRSTGLNSVTYNLPSNFALPTATESVLYISLPAIEIGACTVEFVDATGGKMSLAWNGGKVNAGNVREFKPITYKPNISANLDPFEKEEDIIYTALVYGYVKDTNGKPIEGVAVSDGFSIVTTDSEGLYQIDASKDTWYIYITVPAEYEIPITNNQPTFYQKYEKNKARYDFALKPLAGGKEEKFALFVIGDPQVGSDDGRNRLRDEAIPAIKEHAKTWQNKGVPCYGITLGDLISNNNSADRSRYREDVYSYFASSRTGMPVFHVMGNHDNTYFNAENPLVEDERSSTFELKAQRDHEEVCGPVNFSFDRGDMHIISMRNILYNRNNDCEGELRRSFLKEQYEWLKQDLALVPKDKTVILCVHIPFQDGGGSYVDYTRNLINGYKEAHIMSGHSHIIQHIKGAKAGYSNIYEHNMGALCGAWWTSYMCGDGSPAGYGVFLAEGTTFTDWYHIGYSATAKNRSHQMRLYRGNTIAGGTKKTGTTGYYAFNFEEDVLLANVYMADEKWTVKVYEEGEEPAVMTLISTDNILTDKEYYRRPKIYVDETTTPSSAGYMRGNGSSTNPYISTVATSGDIYFSGYTNGVRAFNDWKFGTNSQCYHMYMYKLKRGDFSKIKVEATDKFGNIYTETEVTENNDFSTVAY